MAIAKLTPGFKQQVSYSYPRRGEKLMGVLYPPKAPSQTVNSSYLITSDGFTLVSRDVQYLSFIEG